MRKFKTIKVYYDFGLCYLNGKRCDFVSHNVYLKEGDAYVLLYYAEKYKKYEVLRVVFIN